MERQELTSIVAAVLIMFIVTGTYSILRGDSVLTLYSFLFSVIIVLVPIIVKKATAYSLDASVAHRTWHFQTFGVKPKQKLTKEQPFGLFVPLFFTLISLGAWKVMTLLSYETRALKQRAAKRFGAYSFTEMTDWHNGIIGASGVVSLLIVSILSYLIGFEYLSQLSIYYAFWNLVPVSDLDGTQIFFGSRVLWTTLSIITLIFTFYAVAVI